MRSVAAALAAAVALAAPGLATAQDAGAAGQLRALCTDRPTKSTAPCTVDPGHFQIESDLVNVTVDHSGGGSVTTWLATDPTLKYGLTPTLDVEAGIVPLAIVVTRDPVTGARTTRTGIGDLFLKAKWNLLGDDGGDVSLALNPFIKAPTATGGVGNGDLEAGLIAPVSINLPLKVQLTIDPEVDLLRNAANPGHHVNTSGLLGFSRPVSKAVTASAELWSDVNLDPLGTVTQASVDLGLAWIPSRRPNLQFDGGVNLGINHATPGVQAYVGISRRF
ncbi:MAG: transporter [Caulobacteraceae bacterium]